MNLPNKLTVLRMVLTVPFLALLYFPDLHLRYLMVLIYLIILASDILDGKMARKHKQATNLGKFLDPVSDKILVVGALIVLVDLDLISVWIPVLISMREFLVTGFRSIASSQNVIVSANIFGKSKFALQTFAILLATLLLLGRSLGWPAGADAQITASVQVFMWLSVLATLVSAYPLIAPNLKAIKEV